METKWNDLTEAERAAFKAWHAERSRVKHFKDMTAAEKEAFLRKNHLPVPRGGVAR